MPPLTRDVIKERIVTRDVIKERIELKKLTTDPRLVHVVRVLSILYQEILLVPVKSVITIGKVKDRILVSRGQDLKIEGRIQRTENQGLEKKTLNQGIENQEDKGRSHENKGIVICQKIGGHAIEKKNIKAIDEVDQGHAIFTEMTEGGTKILMEIMLMN